MGADTPIAVCNKCGESIKLSDGEAAFYQGDLRMHIGHMIALNIIAYKEIEHERELRRCKGNCFEKCYGKPHVKQTMQKLMQQM